MAISSRKDMREIPLFLALAVAVAARHLEGRQPALKVALQACSFYFRRGIL